MTISTKTSADKSRTYYYIEFGKAAGQRTATGIYTINNPKTQQERSFNKEQLAIINTKRMELELEINSTGSGYIPSHKFKHNFLDFYSEYVHANKKYANRHLENSLAAFKTFLGRDRIGPSDITHNLCERFRSYLLEHYNGETPSGYFSRFKKVLKSATREGYFKVSPAEDLKSKAKESKVKDILGIEDYDTLKEDAVPKPRSGEGGHVLSLYCAPVGGH
jgi:integrase/recombinase XerD